MEFLEPILALATPPGRAGIAVLRLSGSGLCTWLPEAFGWKGEAPAKGLRRIVDARGALIDQVLVLSFRAPGSFTGEDAIELHCHGSPVVVEELFERLLELGRGWGLRLARPGEFSQRAFLNGRIDLAQAEALADLIASETVLQARAAARAMQGDLSARVNCLLESVQGLRLLVEAALDFPEEPVESLASWGLDEALAKCAEDLQRELPAFKRGAMLQQGLRIALIGPPNVGKSSLLNALSGKDLAIVDTEPGTTRDRIEQAIDLGGFRVIVTDTAGIRNREEAGRIESLGIERSWQAAAEADLVLLMTSAEEAQAWAGVELDDWPQRFEAEAFDWFRLHCPSESAQGAIESILVVVNKADLLPAESRMRLLDAVSKPKTARGPYGPLVLCSTRAAEDAAPLPDTALRIGCEALIARLRSILGLEHDRADPLIARARHVDALERALMHVESAAAFWRATAGQADLMAEELRLAQRALGEITGIWSDEELLGEIFGRFCIGK